jgi:hypothetical protein
MLDSGNSSDAGGTDGGNPCTAYTTTTIASMRQGSAGCFRLASVLNLAVMQSNNPRMYVQDMGGADFSAIVATCVANSPTHPCSFASQLRNVPQAGQVNLTGEYVKDATTGVEQFQLDSYANVGQGTLGAAASAQSSAIQRSGSARNLAYQRVTVTLSGPLAMFDWSPPEFVSAGALTCPYQLGFGLIPAGGVTGAPCANASSQPAGMVTVAPAEVLVSTELAPGFTISSDCRCANPVPTTGSSVSGQVGGILSFAAAPGADAGYFYLAPTSNADLPLGNLGPP